MLLSDAQNLADFVSELQAETDRGLPLVSAALIDKQLIKILQAFFIEGTAERLLSGSNAPLGNFSARIDACYALGLITEFEYRETSLIRKIRNIFAHEQHGISFDSIKIVHLCQLLGTRTEEDDRDEPVEHKIRFMHAAVNLALKYLYRADYVRDQQRNRSEWPYAMKMMEPILQGIEICKLK